MVILIICFDIFKGIINSNYLLLNDILKRNEFPFNNANYTKMYILSKRVLEVHECCLELSFSFCISPSPVIKISWLTYGIFFTSFKKNILTLNEKEFFHWFGVGLQLCRSNSDTDSIRKASRDAAGHS